MACFFPYEFNFSFAKGRFYIYVSQRKDIKERNKSDHIHSVTCPYVTGQQQYSTGKLFLVSSELKSHSRGAPSNVMFTSSHRET